ncbi:hypothetical protein ACFQ9X_29785 [Catenulispora yoronensis]
MTDPVMPQNQDPYPYRYSQSYQLPGQQPELSQQPYPEGGPEAPQGAPAWRPGAADRLRALAVGVLNLSGLGLGYVVTRRWVAAVVCWAATGALLLAVLPASPKAPPAWLLIGYLGFLVVVAVHGAVRALLRPLKWPRQTWIAAAMAVVLLVVPVGGVVLFNNARANAIQTMLLGRLKAADDIVAAAKGNRSAPRSRPTAPRWSATGICWSTTAIPGPGSWCRTGWRRSTGRSPPPTTAASTATPSSR